MVSAQHYCGVQALQEPVVCTVLPKRRSLPVICLWNRSPLKVLNDSTLILNVLFRSIWNHSKFKFYFQTDYQQTLQIQIQGSQGCQKSEKLWEIQNYLLPGRPSTYHWVISKNIIEEHQKLRKIISYWWIFYYQKYFFTIFLMNFDVFFNGFWFYSILVGWSIWQGVFLNSSQTFWSFDTPGCASAVIWNRFEPFLLQWHFTKLYCERVFLDKHYNYSWTVNKVLGNIYPFLAIYIFLYTANNYRQKLGFFSTRIRYKLYSKSLL